MMYAPHRPSHEDRRQVAHSGCPLRPTPRPASRPAAVMAPVMAPDITADISADITAGMARRVSPGASTGGSPDVSPEVSRGVSLGMGRSLFCGITRGVARCRRAVPVCAVFAFLLAGLLSGMVAGPLPGMAGDALAAGTQGTAPGGPASGQGASGSGRGDLFTPLGPGGGGGMYVPSMSPYEQGLVFVATDMGGVFRSEDDGARWRLIPFGNGLRYTQLSPPMVHFPRHIAWVTERSRVTMSHDRGASWTTQPPGPWGKSPVTRLAGISGAGTGGATASRPYGAPPSGADGPDVLFAGTKDGVWRTTLVGGRPDGWQRVLDGGGSEIVSLDGMLYTFTGDGTFMTSRDRGVTWGVTAAAASVGGRVASFTGATDGSRAVLLASVEGRGLIRSVDGGRDWATVKPGFENERHLTMAPGQTRVAYAAQTGGVAHKQLLRSTDGGVTWEKTFRMAMPWDKVTFGTNVERSWVQTSLGWGYYLTANPLAVHPTGDGFLLLATQGDLYVSRDGGDSWRQAMSAVLPPDTGAGGAGASPRLATIGLEVTSAWGYLFDPHDPQRTYIAYTDIGFARSLDRGSSWQWSAKGSPWTNTFYDVVVDPAVPGRLYAAASMRHDIPHGTSLSPTNMGYGVHAKGGVVVSDDHGASWRVPYDAKGAPDALPSMTCTTIALDETSPAEARVLYAGFFGERDDDRAGVYRSEDGGRTWRDVSLGLGSPGNLHVYRVRIHPVTRELYCLITGISGKGTNFTVPGGLWKSADGGATWQDLTAGSPLAWWATNLAFDPADPRTIYVSAATAPGHWLEGGIYRTTDGGRGWKQVLSDKGIQKAVGGDSFDHTMAVAVHPDDPKLVYAGTTLHGLLYSRDRGESWQAYAAFPFAAVTGVTFDPADRTRMIVTTFGGGVWSGPVLPEN